MSWLSEARLVSAISNAGGFGVIACGSLNSEQLKEQIIKTRSLTDRPFGVNLITMHPALEELIQVCIGSNITHVALAGGLPPSDSIKRLKDSKIKVLAFAPTLAVGKRLVRAGVDALIIEGLEAGGHVGPVSTSVLAQEILPAIRKVPVYVAGGIGRGAAMAMYLNMGASGVQMGTRFVCAKESIAHPKFKEAFIRANARDAVLTVQIDKRFPVIPVRALSNKGTELFYKRQQEVISECDAGKMTVDEAKLAIEHFWAGALHRAAIEGDVEYGSIMAGQSIGLIKEEQTLQSILDEFVSEALMSFADH